MFLLLLLLLLPLIIHGAGDSSIQHVGFIKHSNNYLSLIFLGTLPSDRMTWFIGKDSVGSVSYMNPREIFFHNCDSTSTGSCIQYTTVAVELRRNSVTSLFMISRVNDGQAPTFVQCRGSGNQQANMTLSQEDILNAMQVMEEYGDGLFLIAETASFSPNAVNEVLRVYWYNRGINENRLIDINGRQVFNFTSSCNVGDKHLVFSDDKTSLVSGDIFYKSLFNSEFLATLVVEIGEKVESRTVSRNKTVSPTKLVTGIPNGTKSLSRGETLAFIVVSLVAVIVLLVVSAEEVS